MFVQDEYNLKEDNAFLSNYERGRTEQTPGTNKAHTNTKLNRAALLHPTPSPPCPPAGSSTLISNPQAGVGPAPPELRL